MNRTRFAFILAAAVLALGCGSDKSTDATPAPEAATTGASFRLSTGKFDVQTGDTFECFYTDVITDHQLNVNNATAVAQGEGGHHLVVYYTDQKVPVGHHPCSDVEMLAYHQVAATTNGKEGVAALPEGYATKIPAGKQLIILSHHVRTAPGALSIEDVVDLKTLEDAEVKSFANAFVINDSAFSVAPRSMNKGVTDCTVPRDFDVLLLLGHMHESGMHYSLERVDETGKPLEMIYETDWDPLYISHPPVTKYDPAKPLKLTKGSHIRQTCQWKNSGDTAMVFPHEMCVMFSYYVPDDGFIVCDAKVVP